MRLPLLFLLQLSFLQLIASLIHNEIREQYSLVHPFQFPSITQHSGLSIHRFTGNRIYTRSFRHSTYRIFSVMSSSLVSPSIPPSLSKDEIYAIECEINHTTCTVKEAISDDGTTITILGFGSLLSEKSSRLTFPNLTNFRLVRVPNYQRMFAHPTSIFFQRKIANLSTLEMASLSCEYNPNCSFIAIAFDIPVSQMIDSTTNTYTPKSEFVQREEEFAIIPLPYIDQYDDRDASSSAAETKVRVGMICAKSSDEIYMAKWGLEHFQLRYQQYGISEIWSYPSTFISIKPCTMYL